MANRYDKQNPPMTSAEMLLGSFEAARELGGDVTGSLRRSGIPASQVRSGEGFLPLHKVVDFLNDAAEHLDSAHFGLLVAKHQPPARFSMMGQLIRFAPTLGVCIDDAIRFSILNSEYSLWLTEQSDATVSLIRRTRVVYDAPMAQMQTLSVCTVYKAMNAICRRRVRLQQVHFSHAPPPRADRVEQFFGAPVLFNQGENALLLPCAELATPIPSADADVRRLLLDYLSNLAREQEAAGDADVVTRVRHCLQRSVGSRSCNLDGISRDCGVHPRALQRALKEHGTSFRGLLRDVRQELAENYLRNSSISVAELSDVLGYRNPSAFSRAFKLCRGEAPDHWRASPPGA